jgi:hypothetical protein
MEMARSLSQYIWMHLSMKTMVVPKAIIMKTQWVRMERMENNCTRHQNNHCLTYVPPTGGAAGDLVVQSRGRWCELLKRRLHQM